MILHHGTDLAGPRRSGNVADRLDEVRLLPLPSMVAEADGVADGAEPGHERFAHLRCFLPS
ncbi:hypothetical protein [Methylobacterium terrae]|uniref:hypothetical protein n=1 Tax=Methylobacterium terrae TaxID=2202827 RepID=UPI001ABF3425|nr:hypothetical protein [Methylobacterium terrae]